MKNKALVFFEKAKPIAIRVWDEIVVSLKGFFDYNFTQKEGGSVGHFVEAILIIFHFFFKLACKPVKVVKHLSYFLYSSAREYFKIFLPFLKLWYACLIRYTEVVLMNFIRICRTYLTREQISYLFLVKIPTEFPHVTRLLNIWILKFFFGAGAVINSIFSLTRRKAVREVVVLFLHACTDAVLVIISVITTVFLAAALIVKNFLKILAVVKERCVMFFNQCRTFLINFCNSFYLTGAELLFMKRLWLVFSNNSIFMVRVLRSRIAQLYENPAFFDAVFCSTGIFCTAFRLFRNFCFFEVHGWYKPQPVKVQFSFSNVGRTTVLLCTETAVLLYSVSVILISLWLVFSSVYRFAFLVMFPVSGPSMSFAGAFKDWMDWSDHFENTKRFFLDFTQYFSNEVAVGSPSSYTDVESLTSTRSTAYYLTLVAIFFEKNETS